MRKPLFVFFAAILGAVFLFGQGFSFTEAAALPAPTSPSPGNGATAEQPVELKWSRVTFPGGVAGGYLIEISGGFLGNQKEWAQTNSFVLNQSLAVGAKHRWRVAACFGFSVQTADCGPWSNNGNTWEFTPTLAEPELISPPNTLTKAVVVNLNGSVSLTWEEVVGANRYNVVLNKTSGTTFTHTFEDLQCNLSSTDPRKLDCSSEPFISFAIPSQWIQLNESYTWQVIPLQNNTPGPASDLWKFFVTISGKPTLVAPKDRSVFTVVPPDTGTFVAVGFKWNKTGSTGMYRLEFFGDGEVPPATKVAGEISGSFPFKVGTYEWQVTACEQGFINCGPTSNRWEFTVTKDDKPPSIQAFSVEPDVPDWTKEVTISWRVTDELGGSNLKEVQVYRVPYNEDGCNVEDVSECANDWERIHTIAAPPNSRTWSCRDTDNCLVDSPDEGIYLYGIHVLDNAKNEITETQARRKRVKVQVDKTPPEITEFKKANPAVVNAKNRTVTFEYEVADNLSGLEKVQLFRLTETGDPSADPYKTQRISGASTTGEFEDTLPLGVEEIYTYFLRVFDQAGNMKTSSPTLSFVVDTKVPLFDSCNIGQNVKYWNVTSEGVLVLLAVPLGTKEAEKYVWDFDDKTSETTVHPDAFVEHRYKPGRYRPTLELVDEVGNTSKTCSVTVDIDDDKPRIRAFTVEPDVPDWVNDANPEVKISWRVTDNGDSGLAWVQVWRADVTPLCVNGDEDACVWGPQQERIPVPQDFQKDWSCNEDCFVGHPGISGEYWYGIHVADRAGNEVTESDSGFRVKKVQVNLIPLAACGFIDKPFKDNPLKILFIPNDATINQEKDLTFTWDFGDGKSGTGLTAEHVYKFVEGVSDKVYDVFLTVTNKVGNAKTCSRLITVEQGLPGVPGPPPEPGDICDPNKPNSCGGTGSGLVCDPAIGKCVQSGVVPGEFPNPLGVGTFTAVLNTILNFLFNIALVVAPLTILAAAFMFVTGGGNPEQVSRAKKTLIWTVVGLIVIILSRGIVAALQGILGV